MMVGGDGNKRCIFVIFMNRNKGGVVVGDWIAEGSWCLWVVSGTDFFGFLFLGKQDRGMGRWGMCLLVWLLSGDRGHHIFFP
jgi:hypothetical protein